MNNSNEDFISSNDDSLENGSNSEENVYERNFFYKKRDKQFVNNQRYRSDLQIQLKNFEINIVIKIYIANSFTNIGIVIGTATRISIYLKAHQMKTSGTWTIRNRLVKPLKEVCGIQKIRV